MKKKIKIFTFFLSSILRFRLKILNNIKKIIYIIKHLLTKCFKFINTLIFLSIIKNAFKNKYKIIYKRKLTDLRFY